MAAQLPVFDIQIGQNSVDVHVSCNGQDITKYLSGLTFECKAGELTKATLVVRPGSARATVKSVLEDVTVVEAKPVLVEAHG